MITNCPVCDSKLADSIEARMCKHGIKRMRPLKKGWKACPLVACRRVINIETGEVWKGNKLERKGSKKLCSSQYSQNES